MEVFKYKRDSVPSPEVLREQVTAHNVVLIKNLVPAQHLIQLRQELEGWRLTEAPAKEFYPEDRLNFHLPAHGQGAANQPSPEYDSQATGYWMHNFRIGNMFAQKIQNHLPTISRVAGDLIGFCAPIIGVGLDHHARAKGRNLFFEVAHFPTNRGHIEAHTHAAMLGNGQLINPLLMAARRGEDFEEGGLWVEHQVQHISLERDFDIGDLVLMRMDELHGVSAVRSRQEHHMLPFRGRWTCTLFYYDPRLARS